MIFRLHSLFVFVSAALMPWAPLSAQNGLPEIDAEVRTWTSLAGSSFAGRLKEILPGEVVLVNAAAGRQTTVRLDQLSMGDREYVRTMEREHHYAVLDFFQAGEFGPLQLPTKAEIEGVRHVSQHANYCVPASAEMLLRFYGYDYDQDYIAQISSRDSARNLGTNFSHLTRALSNIGIDSAGIGQHSPAPGVDPTQNRLKGIRTAVSEGFPVIISHQTSGSGHAVLVVGYDDRRKIFWVMDPARGKRPQYRDYEVIGELLTGALIILPRPAGERPTAGDPGAAERREFLSQVSEMIRSTRPSALQDLSKRLGDERIQARYRDANRGDLRNSQGQTRSFARQDGVDFVRLALDRGTVMVAPQNFDEGPGLILIYGTADKLFRAVEYRPGGTIQRVEVRPLDFSLRWIWREGQSYSLPIVEIELPA